MNKIEAEIASPYHIARYFQSLFNEAYGESVFGVYINHAVEVETAYKYRVVMGYSYEPNSLEGTRSANYRLTFTVNCPDGERVKMFDALQRACATHDGSFIASVDEERHEFFLRYTLRIMPSGGRAIINAQDNDTLVLGCDMSIARDDGAMISDSVKTYIVADGDEYEIAYKTAEKGCEFDTESTVPFNHDGNPTVMQKGVTNPLTLFLIYQNTRVCRILRDMASGIINDGDNPFFVGNSKTSPYVMTIKEEYPDKTIESNYYLLSVKENRERGSYASLVLSLLRKADDGD